MPSLTLPFSAPLTLDLSCDGPSETPKSVQSLTLSRQYGTARLDWNVPNVRPKVVVEVTPSTEGLLVSIEARIASRTGTTVRTIEVTVDANGDLTLRHA